MHDRDVNHLPDLDRQHPRLAQHLKALHRPTSGPSSAVDEAVRHAARRHFQAVRPQRPVWRRARPWAAAAALLLATTWAAHTLPRAHTAGGEELAGDLDRSGRIDIIDALLLAQRIEAGRPDAVGDVDGNGVVDAADLDAVARRAVALHPQREEVG